MKYIKNNGNLKDKVEIEYLKSVVTEQEEKNKATQQQILALQNALITSKISGGGITTITDSSDNQIKNLKVFGKSEQVQITGAQLFNINDLIVGYYTTDGNVDEANINRLSTKLLDLQSGQTDLYIAGLPVNVKVIYIQMGVSGVVNRESGIMSNIKKKIETNTTRIGFSFYKDDNSAVSREELSNCMINYGVSAKPYEPYTGGKPSPSPECPQEIVNAGENETIDLEITGENVELQSLTLSTPNGLPGLKVDKDGNYTDSTGQQWICDEIDLARGKYIQRIGKYIFIGSEPVSEQPNRDGYIIPIAKLDDNILENKSYLSNRFIFSKKAWVNDGEFGLQAGVMFITDKNFAHFNSSDGLKTFLKDNETYIIYPLIRPIETDLPQETITVFKTLHTNYPTTVISNDENAGMEAAYVADTKHYIDKKFEELNQAIVNTQIALL